MAVKLVAILPESGPGVADAIARLAGAGLECQAGYAPLPGSGDAPSSASPRMESLWRRVLCVPVERASDPDRVRAAWPAPGLSDLSRTSPSDSLAATREPSPCPDLVP